MPSSPSAAARLHGLVPCAGSGARAGATIAKQYVAVAGRPMVEHTLCVLARVERLARVLVVLAPADIDFERVVRLPAEARVEVVRCGGATRAASVAAGLAELVRLGADAGDWVLVHDAARCLVRAEWVDALIDACSGDAVGGLLACAVADTHKRGHEGRVAATVARDPMWLAQTPQMFRLGVLVEALHRAGAEVTDEAGAIEAMGLAPKLVAAPAENFKVTHAADFAVAEALLLARATNARRAP